MLDPFLVEKLLAHDTVELPTQVGNTLVVGSLHLSHRVDDVTAKREISAGCDRPHRRDY
ncbi:MAG: hypothetical protein WA196_22950 [Pseudolabrys sp.]